MVNLRSSKVLGDITNTAHIETRPSSVIEHLSEALLDDPSRKSFEKFARMSLKTQKLSLDIKDQIEMFKQASKSLLKNSLGHCTKFDKLNQNLCEVKKNIGEVLVISKEINKAEEEITLNANIKALRMVREKIAELNIKIAKSEREIFEKELENTELLRKIDKIETSMSMYFTQKEQKCKCDIF